MEERRKRRWKWPLWYYGMIVVTLASVMAGVYFRGDKVQSDLQVDRLVLGSLVTIFIALATWAFNTLLREIRNTGIRLANLTDALFSLEAKLHPEKSQLIMSTFQGLIRSKKNGEFREL